MATKEKGHFEPDTPLVYSVDNFEPVTLSVDDKVPLHPKLLHAVDVAFYPALAIGEYITHMYFEGLRMITKNLILKYDLLEPGTKLVFKNPDNLDKEVMYELYDEQNRMGFQSIYEYAYRTVSQDFAFSYDMLMEVCNKRGWEIHENEEKTSAYCVNREYTNDYEYLFAFGISRNLRHYVVVGIMRDNNGKGAVFYMKRTVGEKPKLYIASDKESLGKLFAEKLNRDIIRMLETTHSWADAFIFHSVPRMKTLESMAKRNLDDIQNELENVLDERVREQLKNEERYYKTLLHRLDRLDGNFEFFLGYLYSTYIEPYLSN